jgi:formyl-CoA transferase
VRNHGYSKDGVPLWWKMMSRNKRAVTLNLGTPEGQELFKKLCTDADVVIENFRPGTFERWGLGYDVLSEINPALVMARVTGFGQFGPYSNRVGFGTIAEAMSGFAAITGEADGPPTLPPFGLADGITGVTTAFAIMTALSQRNTSGLGQVIDMAIIEPILTILGSQPTVFDQMGIVAERVGNRSVNNSPRNTYKTKDGRWLAISTSAQSVAERVVSLVGRPDLVEKPWFKTAEQRVAHADVLDAAVGGWIAERTADEVIQRFDEAEAAVAPIYDVRDVMADPQYSALGSIAELDDPELGKVKMQNVVFRLSRTPGRIRWAGRKLGQDNAEVFSPLGVDQDQIAAYREKGIM